MNYTLGQLLEDKELRKTLAEEVFSFTDSSGDFYELDFEGQSMRQNHITAFGVLYALGGEKLFEEILAGGKTCLTKDPNAAKVGVVPVYGAEGWYLKTNASAAAAFASVLNGLAALKDEERFSFSTYEKSTANRIVAEFANNYVPDIMFGGLELKTEEKDGRFVLINADTDEQITFSLKSIMSDIEIDSFYAIEPLDEDNPIGYRYQTEEDGLWGYFEKELEQVVPPTFTDIFVTDGGYVMAYAPGSFGSDYKHLLYCPRYSLSALNMFCGYAIDGEGFPTKSASVEIVETADDKEMLFYRPSTDSLYGIYGFVFIPGETPRRVYAQNGVLKGAKSKIGVPIMNDAKYPHGKICARDCLKLYGFEPVEHSAVRRLTMFYYVLERDGYYALARFTNAVEDNSAALELVGLLTPYAFTSVSHLADDYAVVEQFGKKGLFNLKTRKYIIPCEYEKIGKIYGSENHFCIEKAGFEGKVKIVDDDLKWIEHLHR